MAANYTDNGLLRGSQIVTIPDSTNANLNVNVLLKTLSFEAPVRSAYEYDENGLPKASSHVREFRKFSCTFMGYANTNTPAPMAKFTLNVAGMANVNAILLTVKKEQSTEGVTSYSADGTELAN